MAEAMASSTLRLRHVFLDEQVGACELVTISGAIRHHLVDVVRLRLAEEVVLRDPQGGCLIAVVAGVERHSIVFRITGSAAPPPPPPCHITVLQAPGKGDRFEQVLKHGTEIGVARFVPLITRRCVAALSREPNSESAKIRRWNVVLRSAAEQSKRDSIPTITQPQSIEAALDLLACDGLALLLDQDGAPLLQVIASERRAAGMRPSYALFVGPEGGFTADEKDHILAGGAVGASLAPYVLRTETAALAASSVLIAQAMVRR